MNLNFIGALTKTQVCALYCISNATQAVCSCLKEPVCRPALFTHVWENAEQILVLISVGITSLESALSGRSLIYQPLHQWTFLIRYVSWLLMTLSLCFLNLANHDSWRVWLHTRCMPLKCYIFVHLDDMIYCQTLNEHVAHVRVVLLMKNQHHVKLNKSFSMHHLSCFLGLWYSRAVWRWTHPWLRLLLCSLETLYSCRSNSLRVC